MGIAAEHVEVLAVVGEVDAANLAEHIDRLLRAERLRVDQVDVVGLLGRNQYRLPAASRGEAQPTDPGHLGSNRA